VKLSTERNRGKEGKVNGEREKTERERERERERENAYKHVQSKWYSSVAYYYILIERNKDYLEPIQYNLFNIN